MIYIMSDIHGEREKFNSIMEKIKLKPEDKLYVLGDIIDRGKDGIGILLDLMEMDNATVLLGNHELMLMNAISPTASMIDIKTWYRNHGDVTYNAYMELPTETQNKILEYISRMPLSVELTVNEKTYILVHGAPSELKYRMSLSHIPDIEFSTWVRLKANEIIPKGKIVIFGHTPTDDYQLDIPLKIWFADDKIGIDCGNGYNHPAYRLSCLRLDDLQEFYSD